MKGRISKIALALLTIAMTAACAKESPITLTQLNFANNGGDNYATLKSHVKSSKVSISIEPISIKDPTNGREIGVISVSNLGAGVNEIVLSLNVSSFLKLPPLNKVTTLPNGMPFPVLLVDPNNWTEVAIGSAKSRLFFNVDLIGKQAVIGYALSADILSTGTAANVFFDFTAGSANFNVTGIGGIYSGTAPGQSGFALFADFNVALGSFNGKPMVFKDETPVEAQEAIMYKLLEIHQNRSVIEVR